MGLLVWEKCLERLQDEFSSQQFNTWIRPLQVRMDESCLRLLAPNPYVRDKVEEKFLVRIQELINDLGDPASPLSVDLGVGSRDRLAGIPVRGEARDSRASGGLIGTFRFETFVEGNSNELARAAAFQVSENAGQSYNPLLLYGGVGLGKTHLMHAVGNEILMKTPQSRVVYLHSQRFVQDMVKALQTGTMQDFMHHYRSVDALLIDDIQFFANKMRSQEEFFHVFNALYERGNQMVFTCDRYPSEIQGLEERLKSRFVYGLTVEVEAPDLETRVAILLKKAEAQGITLDSDVAFYMAERIRSNVRELEGALRRVLASAHFGGHRITVEHVRRSLRDLIAIQDRQVSVDNI
ncbi:MAG: chromosomal replication initiator protein DnaA, partial [Pseudomonadota bacterium]|nr:chromosomal replication initiator protein DnaA [Pseudomonadota bacterium]